MFEISKEEYDKLYKQNKFWLKAIPAVSTASLIIYIIVIRTIRRSVDTNVYLIILLVFLAVDIILIALASRTKKKFIPKQHTYESVKNVFQQMNRDLASDTTVNMFMSAIDRAREFEERTMLCDLLSDVYMMRGEYENSIKILKLVDTSQFPLYPETGMSFYSNLIEIYCDMKDYESVLAAYKDAESFFKLCGKRNYICAQSAATAMTDVFIAMGDYSKAYEYQKMISHYQDDFRKNFQKDNLSLVQRFTIGAKFCREAELNFYLGNYAEAAKDLDIGGPLTSLTPHLTAQANELSAKIREKLNNP